MRARAVAAVVAATTFALGGCTWSGGEQAAPSAATGGSTTTDGTSEPTEQQTQDGPSPEELSGQVLELAAAPVGDPIARQTVSVPEVVSTTDDEPDVTIEVLALQRTDDATLLTLQMSSPEPVRFGPRSFTDATGPEQEFFGRFALDDTDGGTRYLPLSWLRPDSSNLDPSDGPPNSCICPYRGGGAVFGPEPIVFDSLYGPLPDDVESVSLTGPHGLDLRDIPVQTADD